MKAGDPSRVALKKEGHVEAPAKNENEAGIVRCSLGISSIGNKRSRSLLQREV